MCLAPLGLMKIELSLLLEPRLLRAARIELLLESPRCFLSSRAAAAARLFCCSIDLLLLLNTDKNELPPVVVLGRIDRSELVDEDKLTEEDEEEDEVDGVVVGTRATEAVVRRNEATTPFSLTGGFSNVNGDEPPPMPSPPFRTCCCCNTNDDLLFCLLAIRNGSLKSNFISSCFCAWDRFKSGGGGGGADDDTDHEFGHILAHTISLSLFYYYSSWNNLIDLNIFDQLSSIRFTLFSHVVHQCI